MPLFTVEFNRYFEPFLGGGAMFFYLISVKNKRFTSYLSDINSELINSYAVVKDNVEKLIDVLKVCEIKYKKSQSEYYYKLRANTIATPDIEKSSSGLLPLIELATMVFIE